MLKPSQDFSGTELDLVPGKLIAYRSWHLAFNTLELESMTQNGTWSPGENIALCKRSSRCNPPADFCTCGYYGAYNIHSGKIPKTKNSSSLDGITVFGAFEAYGKITFGLYGFRAQKVKLVAIVDPGFLQHTKFAETYNCLLFDSKDKLMMAIPAPSLKEIGIEIEDEQEIQHSWDFNVLNQYIIQTTQATTSSPYIINWTQ
jgi:hypothetical protein